MMSPKGYSKRKLTPGFGEYLRRLREDNTEYIGAEAARKLEISRQELHSYEKGSRMPSYPMLLRMARLYHRPSAEVLERAYWPQLVLLPLIAIVDPEQLSRDLIEELEKGLRDDERQEITQRIKKLLRRRVMATQR
jgi:transcriptional regulator with XRE-family HTH domain